jgi:hypothetical protein
MKRNTIKTILFSIVAGGMMLLVGCGKKNIRWIIGGHRYHVAELYIKNSSGEWKRIQDIGLGFADNITFIRNDLMIDGDITVTNTSYETTDYSAYGGTYDQSQNCYYYSDQYYSVTYQRTEESVSHYKWKYKSDGVMNMTFSENDPLINGAPGTLSLWKAMSGDYSVEEDSRAAGQAYAGVIVLKKDNVRMILKY